MKTKPQRFWAALDRDGEIRYHAIWRHRGNAEIDAASLGTKVVQVEVRVVTPKPRKRKGAK